MKMSQLWHDRIYLDQQARALWGMAHECRDAMTDEAQAANLDGQKIFKRRAQLETDMAECYALAHVFALGAWR